jgi:ferredoxin
MTTAENMGKTLALISFLRSNLCELCTASEITGAIMGVAEVCPSREGLRLPESSSNVQVNVRQRHCLVRFRALSVSMCATICPPQCNALQFPLSDISAKPRLISQRQAKWTQLLSLIDAGASSPLFNHSSLELCESLISYPSHTVPQSADSRRLARKWQGGYVHHGAPSLLVISSARAL